MTYFGLAVIISDHLLSDHIRYDVIYLKGFKSSYQFRAPSPYLHPRFNIPQGHSVLTANWTKIKLIMLS